MNFQIYPLTVRLNGQISGFGCGVKIVETFEGAVENIEIFGGRAELTLLVKINALVIISYSLPSLQIFLCILKYI